MKALSIQQPWAWLIVQGHKDVENRTWSTNLRCRILVHAGRRFDESGYRWVRDVMHVAMPPISEFERGGLVGEVDLIDCVQLSDSPWFAGPYGFLLRNPRPLRLVPLAGRLGFFEVTTYGN
ncbi:MAG: ASCH domain-containing protein [Acidobacteriota bacterium]